MHINTIICYVDIVLQKSSSVCANIFTQTCRNSAILKKSSTGNPLLVHKTYKTL